MSVPAATKTNAPAQDTTSTSDVVRLSINLAPDVADVLKSWTSKKRISITEGVRRAIAVWNFLETERAQGNRIAIIEGNGDEQRIREVVLVN